MNSYEPQIGIRGIEFEKDIYHRAMTQIISTTAAYPDYNNRENWNKFIEKEPHFSLLQSWDWGEFKKKSGWEVRRIGIEKEGQLIAGAQMLIKPFIRGLLSIAYVPRGPLVNWEDKETASALLDILHSEAGKHRAICLRIEPPLSSTPENHQLLKHYGFQASAHTIQPRCSMIVQLPQDREKLLKSFPSFLRNNIRRCQRKGVEVVLGTADDFRAFYRLMKATSKRAKFPIRPFDYYKEAWSTFHPSGQTQLFLARYEGTPIAVMTSFCFGKHAASFHAASLKEYHSFRVNDLLWWTAMSWAIDQGCQTYDLWGIPDEVGEMAVRNEPIPKGMSGGLWGVYYYKKNYRGDIVYYVGAYDYVYSPLLHRGLELISSRVFSMDRLSSIADRFVKNDANTQ